MADALEDYAVRQMSSLYVRDLLPVVMRWLVLFFFARMGVAGRVFVLLAFVWSQGFFYVWCNSKIVW